MVVASSSAGTIDRDGGVALERAHALEGVTLSRERPGDVGVVMCVRLGPGAPFDNARRLRQN